MNAYHIRCLCRRQNKSPRVASIQNSMIAFTTALVLAVTMALATINYRTAMKLTEDYLDIYIAQTIRSITDQVNSAIGEVKSMITRLVSSGELQDYIRGDIASGPMPLTAQERYIEHHYLEDRISSMYPNWNYIQFMGLYFNDKKYYFGSVGEPSYHSELVDKVESAIYEDMAQGRSTARSIPIYVNRYDLIAIVRPISDFETEEPLYWLVIALKASNISELLFKGNLGEQGKIQLVNREYELLYPQNAEVRQQWEDVRGSLVESRGGNALPFGSFSQSIGRTQVISQSTLFRDWYVVGSIPFGDMFYEMFNWPAIVAFPLICIFLSTLFCIAIARRITQPIYRIVDAMRRVEKQDYSQRIYDASFKETQYICIRFNGMMDHLNRLINDIHTAELERKDAEIASLQAQIRPHFIYNTLENINMMLVIREQEDISQLVTMLGDLLRYNINPRRTRVMLAEDLEQVEKYLKIQQIRFGGRLSYGIHMQKGVESIPIDKLLIQPIVENAVIHGIESLPGGGHIEINAYRKNAVLHIDIRDNGIGFPPGNEEQLLTEKTGETGEQGHIGLGNVHSRIQHYYGKDYGLRIRRRKQGACVCIRLPEEGEW